MKKTYLYKNILLALTLIISMLSCDKKDPNELVNDSKPLVITTSDYTIGVTEGTVATGDTIGIVPGASNKGTINYTIVSQTPANALALTNNYGNIIVQDESLFVAGTQMLLEVKLSKGDVSKTSNITINVNSACPNINLLAFNGSLNIQEDGYDATEGTGITGDCGILTIQGGDIASFGCDLSPNLTLSLTPSGDGDTGTVVLEKQPYNCVSDLSNEIGATGTYSLSERTITLNYHFYTDGEEWFSGTTVITGTTICSSTVDTSIWVGDLNIEDVGYGSVTGTGAITGCGELTITGDHFGFGCENTPSVTYKFQPSSPGATNGTVVAIKQTYDCFSSDNNEFEASGTYDETTGEISLNYSYLGDGSELFPGELSITHN